MMQNSSLEGVDICDEADSRTQRVQSYSKVPFINQEPEAHYVLGVEIDSLVVIDDSFLQPKIELPVIQKSSPERQSACPRDGGIDSRKLINLSVLRFLLG